MSAEKLRALLAEAQSGLMCDHYREAWERCDCAVCAVKIRIDAALAEPVSPANHNCGWRARFSDILKQRNAAVVLRNRFRRERDEARAEVARLRWGNEMACESTPTKGCECPGCGLARERAERGEDGP